MGGSGSDETPHSVTLSSPYWMGETEVTQGQWQALMGKNLSHFDGDLNLPVEQVSWDDAQEYVAALNACAALKNGWRWTLPTEAQWEYACRGGTVGDYAGDLDEMAWYSNNSGSKSHLVGTKAANAWGLNDMHGNVWEWCADWYGDYPRDMAITDIPFCQMNRDFLILKNFAPLSEKTLNQDEWIGSEAAVVKGAGV